LQYGYISYSPETRTWTSCSEPAETAISPRISSILKSQIEPSSVIAGIPVTQDTSGDATMADTPSAIEDQQKSQHMEGVQTAGDRTDGPDEEDSPEMRLISSQMAAVSMQPTVRSSSAVVTAILELKRTVYSLCNGTNIY
jgi:hypothetical protein